MLGYRHGPTKHWLLPRGIWRCVRRRHGRCTSGRSWGRTRWRTKDKSSVAEDTVSDSEPVLLRRSTRRRKPLIGMVLMSLQFERGWLWRLVCCRLAALTCLFAERWLLPRQLGAVDVCISRRVLSEPSCCCRYYVFLTLLFVSADGNCDFMLIKA